MSDDIDGVDRDKIPDEFKDEPLTEDEMRPCSSMMGHQMTPFNDREGGPQTRMACLHCNRTRLVIPGDLRRHSDNHEYPPWCETEGADK